MPAKEHVVSHWASDSAELQKELLSFPAHLDEAEHGLLNMIFEAQQPFRTLVQIVVMLLLA